ncbi:MAG: hypothetical protein HQK60_05045 [Deltaproteobacteria bacterium]|nr:hypothetical protein [Deltaproteobacteria bacterium]
MKSPGRVKDGKRLMGGLDLGSEAGAPPPRDGVGYGVVKNYFSTPDC